MGIYARNTGSFGYAGFFSGNVYISGTLINPSDMKLKKDIEPINNALDAIMSLDGKTYEYKVDEYGDLNLAKGQQVGYLAQEVEEVLPQLVENTKHTTVDLDQKGDPVQSAPVEYKGINYIGMIPVITEAIKEQQQIIETQKIMISNLEGQVNTLANELSRFTKKGSLGNLNQLNHLEQNQPNPFDVSTTIKYTLPAKAQQSAIIIHDMQGKQIKKYMLDGSGELVIDGGSLEAGMYFYSLVSDGTVVSSLKMMLTK